MLRFIFGRVQPCWFDLFTLSFVSSRQTANTTKYVCFCPENQLQGSSWKCGKVWVLLLSINHKLVLFVDFLIFLGFHWTDSFRHSNGWANAIYNATFAEIRLRTCYSISEHPLKYLKEQISHIVGFGQCNTKWSIWKLAGCIRCVIIPSRYEPSKYKSLQIAFYLAKTNIIKVKALFFRVLFSDRSRMSKRIHFLYNTLTVREFSKLHVYWYQ